MGSFDVKELLDIPVLGSVSLNLKPAEIKKQRKHLVWFVSTAVLLVGVYGGALVFRNGGSSALRTWVNTSEQSL